MLQIEESQLDRIRRIAEDAYPHECCGILAGRVEGSVKVVETLIDARNQRTDRPENRYLISAELVHEVEKKLRETGRSIVGFFHSHPDVAARPSAYDREQAWPWYSYLIVSVKKGEAGSLLCWRLRDDRSAFDSEELNSQA
ncbi:MAG: Mov34/MPN/PAD-1 family protein [Acidobacteriota bacterium]